MPHPAHTTKHLPSLIYPFRGSYFHLSQCNNGQSNGTALWLASQCLSAFLPRALTPRSESLPRPRALELGSGIGLSALTLCSLGWDVLATDIPDVISTVLRHNISQNISALPPTSGRIEVRELDWTVTPDHWTWDNPSVIASPLPHSNLGNLSQQLLRPPFDLIISSDTLYSPDLTRPLLRTLHALCISESPSPPIYIAIERRDPQFVDDAFAQARGERGFNVECIPHRKLVKAMQKCGLKWAKDDWDGIEIYKLILPRSRHDLRVDGD